MTLKTATISENYVCNELIDVSRGELVNIVANTKQNRAADETLPELSKAVVGINGLCAD